MRAYIFILLLCPVVLVAQSQQSQPVNGATDCPTFGKKNNFSKAGLFQYMRTHKPPRTSAIGEQQSVYRTSALPDLQKAQEEREAAKKQEKITARAEARRQKKERNKPVITTEPVTPTETADATPVKKEAQQPALAKASMDTPAESIEHPRTIENVPSDKIPEVKEAAISDEATADKAAAKENREKKVKRAAFKAKFQHLFKRTNKPTSRKNVQKCPTF